MAVAIWSKLVKKVVDFNEMKTKDESLFAIIWRHRKQ